VFTSAFASHNVTRHINVYADTSRLCVGPGSINECSLSPPVNCFTLYWPLLLQKHTLTQCRLGLLTVHIQLICLVCLVCHILRFASLRVKVRYGLSVTITHANYVVGRMFESVCLSVCLFVRSITQKRMIQKCSNLVQGMTLG